MPFLNRAAVGEPFVIRASRSSQGRASIVGPQPGHGTGACGTMNQVSALGIGSSRIGRGVRSWTSCVDRPPRLQRTRRPQRVLRSRAGLRLQVVEKGKTSGGLAASRGSAPFHIGRLRDAWWMPSVHALRPSGRSARSARSASPRCSRAVHEHDVLVGDRDPSTTKRSACLSGFLRAHPRPRLGSRNSSMIKKKSGAPFGAPPNCF
jgi:hypothetical protein